MPTPTKKNPVAYFSAEYAIDSNMPTYAGGLGVLAGDTLLQAASQEFPMVAIGILYEGKYFIQKIDSEGWQHENPSLFHKVNTHCIRPLEDHGKPVELSCNFAGEQVLIGVYKQRLAENTNLYFLTTNLDDNQESWRELINAEYWGDDEAQLRTQLVLGIAGMKLLNHLKISPSKIHFNEGRPIFAHWELLLKYMHEDGLSYEKANSLAKDQIVYTNHTLVAAGNKTYNPDLVRKYALPIAIELGIEVNELLKPGLINNNSGFSITDYALNVSSKVSAVSKPHGELSQKQWPDKNWFTITNAVNMDRWQHHRFKDPSLTKDQIWAEHNRRKRILEREVIERTNIGYNSDRLVIGWARRISGYKRLTLLFNDIKRLEKIVKQQGKEVQILIAGKAHPGDQVAKEHIQQVINYMKKELFGYAIYVHNYDLDLAFKLISGCDIWLNTPEYGQEASGTSGMKAAANGVLNFTITDGWAAEVDWANKGWTIDEKNPAECIYSQLESEIIPKFYNRSNEGLPEDWINMMTESISMSRQYSTERMLKEYQQKLYS